MKYQWYPVSRLIDLPQAIVVSGGSCVSNANTVVESDQILSLCFSISCFFCLFVLSARLLWLPFAILNEVSKEVYSVPLSIFKDKILTQLDVPSVELLRALIGYCKRRVLIWVSKHRNSVLFFDVLKCFLSMLVSTTFQSCNFHCNNSAKLPGCNLLSQWSLFLVSMPFRSCLT